MYKFLIIISLLFLSSCDEAPQVVKPLELSVVGRALITQFEGFKPYVYKDAAGYDTIGYGHKLLNGESYPNGINIKDAIKLLQKDASQAEKAIHRYIHVPLSQRRFDALVSFTFNLGVGNLRSSTLLKRINEGKHEQASQEFLRWKYAGGRVLRGLVLRRKAESLLYGS